MPAPEGARDPKRIALGVPEDVTLLLAVGSLDPVEGHDVLIRALGGVAKRLELPAWKLVIAGRGAQESALRRLADELGVASPIELFGLREDVGDLLHAADLFVHPSRSEGLPLAVIEAQWAGLSVVASRVGGIPKAVRHGESGLLVDPEDPHALAGAITHPLTSREVARRLADTACQSAVENHGIDAMADR